MTQPAKAERPSSLKRAPRPAADEKVDPVEYRGEPPASTPVTLEPTQPDTAPTTGPSPKRARRAPTVPFSTRIADDVSQLIDKASAENDLTIRAVVEQAIRQTYGK